MFEKITKLFANGLCKKVNRTYTVKDINKRQGGRKEEGGGRREEGKGEECGLYDPTGVLFHSH